MTQKKYNIHELKKVSHLRIKKCIRILNQKKVSHLKHKKSVTPKVLCLTLEF